MRVAPLGDADVAEVAAFVAGRQRDPSQHVVLAGVEPDVVAAELVEAARWRARLLVARDAGDEIAGVLLADVDEERRRVWWFGPWATHVGVAELLMAAADDRFGSLYDEEEFAPDERNTDVARIAIDRGAIAGTPSAVLVRDHAAAGRAQTTDDPGAVVITTAEPGDVPQLTVLHDQLFPGTHTTGAELAGSDGRDRVVRVARERSRLLGYVAVEVQADGEGYVDYLGVAPSARRRGIARRLVVAALDGLEGLGVTRTSLTVRDDAVGAQDLYASLGFVTERRAVPFRKGFSLESGHSDVPPEDESRCVTPRPPG